MKKIIWTVLLTVALAITACGNKQKASERINIYNDTTKTALFEGNSLKVPFTRNNSDHIVVQVALNGVPFNMVWDTGASSTCISSLELEKMVKEGKIDISDYITTTTIKVASGESAPTHVFLIKDLCIKGKNDKEMHIPDVQALVSPNSDAPLLLGQDVMRDLPRNSINESESVIEFIQ